MARVNNVQYDLQNVTQTQVLARFVGAAFNSILLQLNGKLDFGDNIRCSGPLTVGFTTSSDPVKIPHSLGRQPLGYLVIQQDAAASIYSPNQNMYPWNATQIYLSASAAVNAQIFVI